MKIASFIILLSLLFSQSHSQTLLSHLSEQDSLSGKSLFETVSGIEKKTDYFNLSILMQGGFNANFRGDEFEQAAFKMKEFRIDARGKVTPWLSYRWRQRLNRGNTPAELDNLPLSIDYAMVDVRFSDLLSFKIGKQAAAYGGFEYDLDPHEIYQYSDMIDYMYFDFMTGLTGIYQLNANQQFQIQIVNSRCSSMEELYGILPEGMEKSKLPLAYTLNWNGYFFGNRLATRWSFSLLNQARNTCSFYYVVGNQLNINKLNIYLDFTLSDEELDSREIISDIIRSEENPTCAEYTRYQSWVTKLNYRFRPHWNLFVKGMYETASIYKQTRNREKGKYRTSYGYFGGIEFYPMKENFRFYLAYLGRSYRYTDRANQYGTKDYSTTQLSLGLIYNLPLF